MSIKKVLLDMDGVLTNFHKGVCDAFEHPYDYDTMTRYDFWEDWLDKKVTRDDINTGCSEVFWEDLEWMADGKEILRIVEKAYGKKNIFIPTQPMPNAGSWTGKRIWIEHMAPDYLKRLIITHASKAIFASPETLLIDDRNENVDDFIAAGGNAILVPRPWNRLRRHKVIPHLEKEISELTVSDAIKGGAVEVSSHSDKQFVNPLSKSYHEPIEKTWSIFKDNAKEYHGHPQFYELLTKMAELHSRKNHDYAGKGNPLRNFYKCKEMGLSPFQGVMVRLSDKWSRLESFMKQGTLEVKNESVKDTLMDNAVYSLLSMILLDEEMKDKECPENAPQA